MEGVQSGDINLDEKTETKPKKTTPRVNEEVETAHQVQYEPASQARFAVGTLVPRNMQTAMTRALDALSERVTPQ